MLLSLLAKLRVFVRVNLYYIWWTRFFVADTVLDEILFGWPRQGGSLQLKEDLASGFQRAVNWV